MALTNETVVVFFIPSKKTVNGGILSIFSLAYETRKFLDDMVSQVYISVYPGMNSYIKNDLFPNDEVIVEFEDILRINPSPKKMILHIPEYAAEELLLLLKQHKDYLHSIESLQINILNQNIQLMPRPAILTGYYLFTSNVTQTTAHLRYCTQKVCDQYYVPTHHMSVYIDESQYVSTPVPEKHPVILVSPDEHPEKGHILDILRTKLDKYSVVEIKKVKYSEYKQLISRSMFTITFGEGMDGYFIEPSFSRSIAFTVYNEDFFPNSDFLELPNVYTSYENMAINIVDDIKSMSKKGEYYKVADQAASLLRSYYNQELYREKIKNFYSEAYDFIPSGSSNEKVQITKAMTNDLREELKILKHENAELRSEKVILTSELEVARKKLLDLHSSRSWRLTRPLRFIFRSFLNKH